MRKILFVLVIALTAGCGGGGDDPIIPGPGSATYEQIIAALEDGAGKFDDATFGGSDNPYSDTLSWLKTQPGVQDAGLSDDGSTIWVKYTDGSTGTIITRPLTEGKIGQGINQSTFGNILENSLDLMTFRELAAIVGSKKALILEATDSTIPNDFPESLYNDLKAAGYEQVDIFKNEQVTPDILSNMGNYGVVFFCGHGDLYMSQVEWVTGETVTKDKKTYYETKYGNSIGLAFPSLEGVAKFTIRPAFINQIGGTFPESLVYATACQGLRNTSMAQAFVGKGAQVYIGWTNTVSVYATFYSENKLFGHLVNGHLNVEQAFGEESGDPSFGKDVANGANLDYYPKPAGGSCSLTQIETQGDTTPPVWSGTPGITETIPGDGYITVKYGVASDPESGPVRYRVYYSATTPIPFTTAGYVSDQDGSPTAITNLINGTPYHFAVRAVNCISLEDNNTVTLSGTPTAGVEPCQADNNNSSAQAQTVSLGGNPIDGIVCYPYDGEDYYTFTASGDLKGTLELENKSSLPGLYLTLYKTNCNPPHIAHIEANPKAVVNLESHSLGEGTYYIRVRYGGLDHYGVNYQVKNLGYVQQFPAWDTAVGVTNVVPGAEKATVYYGSATDPQGDPVQYNVYYVDSVNSADPFSGVSHVKIANAGSSPCVINGLTSEHTYYFGVRASDDKGHEEANANTLIGHISGAGELVIVKAVDTENARGVAVSGGYAYVTDLWLCLQIIDIEPLGSAYIRKIIKTSGLAEEVTVSGGYAYVAAGDGRFQIIDIDPPGSAYILKKVDTPDYAIDVTISGGYAYVANTEAGLLIIDIEPPGSAYILKKVDTPDSAYGVAVTEGYAFVADYDGGLQIIDIDPPSSAYIVNAVDIPYTAYGVTVSEGYAYVTTSYGGLYIIDIEPPGSAYIVNTVDIPDWAWGVAVSGGYAYVAAGEGGLYIIDIEPHGSAYIVKAVDTPDWAFGVAVSGGYAYVADDDAGLQIIDLAGYY